MAAVSPALALAEGQGEAADGPPPEPGELVGGPPEAPASAAPEEAGVPEALLGHQSVVEAMQEYAASETPRSWPDWQKIAWSLRPHYTDFPDPKAVNVGPFLSRLREELMTEGHVPGGKRRCYGGRAGSSRRTAGHRKKARGSQGRLPRARRRAGVRRVGLWTARWTR